MHDPKPRVRCGIYTRKSSDEGLEQPFNSLHAQREACEAYIRSQSGEGWMLSRERYDDGGYSGGTLNRPALRRLLDDIAANKIDVIVVYKVDRLTRALPDFARIMELLEKRGASFVSVTQAFNTTTSMGRLTLNVVLSFAQFEREITGERIRDKIAAAKAKGMWMGGMPPLGFDPPANSDRALVVNAGEAVAVRSIFAHFLADGGLYALQKKLDDEGVRSKRWVSTRGRLMGGHRFSRGALRHLLSNRTYLGEITHKGAAYPGRHPAIVDRATFSAAQQLLAENSRKRRTRVTHADGMLLSGLVFDVDGLPMQPMTYRQKRRRYSYYGSKPLPRGVLGDHDGDAIRRVPATAIDDLVMDKVGKVLRLREAAPGRADVRALVGRVEVHPSCVHLVIKTRALPGRPSRGAAAEIVRECLQPGESVLVDPTNAGLLRVLAPVRLVTWGGRRWLTDVDGRPGAAPGQPNPALVRRLRAAHAILHRCGIDPEATAPRSARAPGSMRERQLARLAFLAPDIQAAILRGEITELRLDGLPTSWAKQCAHLLN